MLSSSENMQTTVGDWRTKPRCWRSRMRGTGYAKLFTATKTANTNIPAIPGHDPIKTRPRHKIHNLREQRPSHVHGQASDRKNRAPYREFANLSSNRHQTKSATTHCCTTSIQRTPLA